MWKRSKLMCLLAALMLLAACTNKEEEQTVPETGTETVRVAVVLPYETGGTPWNRALYSAAENVRLASGNMRIVFEHYDESTADIEAVATELAGRKDIVAVIGCYHSANTEILARKCARTYKPVFTFSTSNELPRAFGQRGFLWCLAESDITQSELLLIKARSNGAKRVSLLAGEGIYGQTFTDWFAFQTVELGMEVGTVASYAPEQLEAQFAEATRTESDYLICVPSTAADAVRMQELNHTSDYRGRLLFSDVAFHTQVIAELGEKANGMEGVALTDDPKSGFSIAYQASFDETPAQGEAHVYDAVMITAYAHRYAALHGMDMNEAIGTLLNRKAEAACMWNVGGMTDVFRRIEAGETPAFSGASGMLNFSSGNYTAVQNSVYTHWMVYEGQFIYLDYDNRTENGASSAYAAWEWNKQFMQIFDEEDTPDMVYPERKGNKAVVVAASEGWANYRHQADALAFYQLLKENGYSDEDILLVMADDMAHNANNPEPGVVRRTADGANLYEGAEIDYRLSELTPESLAEVLLGMDSGPEDNVLFFWSGHGQEGSWMWGEEDEATDTLIAETFRRMADGEKYRKMLCFVETCYSGSVAEVCTGIPGLLLFTAANGQETSKADVFNSNLGVWMTNRFTSILLEEVTRDPAIPLRDLYSSMFHRTLGSHVCVYNVPHYGSVYENTMAEFLQR